MRLEPKPCWGRSGATVCTSCALLQMPADYTGSFPVMELQLPAVEHIGTDAEFCRERRSAGTVSRDASVTAEVMGVGVAAHVADCAPTCQVLQPLDVGPADGGLEGLKPASRNASVTGAGA